MPHHYTRTDQVKFLTEWFDSWSEFQREDFIPIMIQVLNPSDHVNGLVGGVNTLAVGERRPSLFDCQVKLFQDWYENWTPSEKERLMQHFTTTDPDFASKLNKSESPSTETVPNDTLPSLPPITIESKDDGLSPGSHSSSPLSSLSQPLSPHDSGLEENHSDLETTPLSKPASSETSPEKVQEEEPLNTPSPDGSREKNEELLPLKDVDADVAKESVIILPPETPLTITNDIQEVI